MANGSRHSMFYVPEATYGTTPANPAWKPIRHTGTTLGLSKDSISSEELRSDRMIADFRQGANQVGGDIKFELSFLSFDDLLEAVLGGTWTPRATTGSQSLSASVGAFARAAGSFLTDGLLNGDTVVVSGFPTAGNNGRFKVTALTATSMSVTPLDGQTMAVDAAAAGRTIASHEATLKAGTVRRSFSVLRQFGDLTGNNNFLYTGIEFNSLELAINANQMVTGTIGIIGQGAAAATATPPTGSTFANPTTTSPLDSFTGALKEGGTTISVITEVQLKLDNSMEARFVVGSKTTILPSQGRSNATGQVSAYFEDSTLVSKFINETASSIEFNLPDTAGNNLKFTLPRIKYTGGQPDVDKEGPIVLSMPIQALLDSTTSTNISIVRTPAP